MQIVKRRIEITLKIFAVFARIFVYTAIPFTMTLLSAFYIRYVPTVFGIVCGPTGDNFCYKPLPRAGFPFSYWIDQGGISVMGQLGFEDEFSALAFGADFLAYFLLIFAVDRFIYKRKARKRELESG